MKISQFMMFVSILAITIPGVYYSFSVYDNSVDNRQALANLSKEITLLKSEISILKKANSGVSEIKKEILQLSAKKTDDILQTQTQNDALKNQDDHTDEIQTAQMDPIEMAKKQEEQRAKDFDLINNAFLAEASDQEWSSKTTALATSFFESEAGAKIGLSDIECRKTLCKIEINNPSSANANDNLMLRFPMHVEKELSQASFFYEQTGDGSTNVIIYLARNGFDLPT
jgi:hypothetical protein